jgi:uncharacterized phiE125 gp8 family phage protein
MSSILLTPPAAEPITLAEAKAYLRVAIDDDDDVIAALVAGARVHVESQTRRALITQSWRIVRDAWPDDGRLAILPVPFVSIAAARVHHEDGTTQSIDVSAFTADTASAPAIVSFAPWSLPLPRRAAGGVELDITAGYGDAGSAVPEALRQAIRLLVAHWYENRGLIAIGHEVAVMPVSVAALISSFRVYAL